MGTGAAPVFTSRETIGGRLERVGRSWPPHLTLFPPPLKSLSLADWNERSNSLTQSRRFRQASEDI